MAGYWESNRGIGTLERVVRALEQLADYEERDLFAAAALPKMIEIVHRDPAVAAELFGNEEETAVTQMVATAAWAYADAMLATRDRKRQP